MQNRIQYIDTLKGLAIFLVVFAHCIPLQFVEPVEGDGFAQLPMRINDFIYLFHMPLFMFLSGYLFYKPVSDVVSWQDFGKSLWKRFQSLIVPYFVAGAALYFLKGMFFVYWYLLVLFEFILICSIVRFVVSRMKTSHCEVILIGLYVLMVVVLFCFFPQIKQYHKAPFLEIEHLSLFPYFLLGLVCHKFSYEKSLLSKEWVLLCVGFIMVFAFILMTKVKGGEVAMSLCKLLFVSALIFVIAYVFYHLPQDSKAMSAFQRLGKYSLEIYILHFFFLFKNPINWEWVRGLFIERGGYLYF